MKKIFLRRIKEFEDTGWVKIYRIYDCYEEENDDGTIEFKKELIDEIKYTSEEIAWLGGYQKASDHIDIKFDIIYKSKKESRFLNEEVS